MSAKVLGGHIALELKARVASAKSGSLPKRWITAAMGSRGWGNMPLRDPCSSFTIEFKFFIFIFVSLPGLPIVWSITACR